MKRLLPVFSSLLVLSLAISACGLPSLSINFGKQLTPTVQNSVQQQADATATPEATISAMPAANATVHPTLPAQPSNNPANNSSGNLDLSTYQTALENIYTKVNPSVVNIEVTLSPTLSNQSPFFNSPGGQNNQPTQQALGSGFVWDIQGHIVTNNHVVSDATQITVTFSDGTIVPAKLTGADPDADLAVIQVDASKVKLTPITVMDSTKVKVGQLAIAIGNPFGLENTMTVGIVSALGRTLPAGSNSSSTTPGYTIPDIIQTDAPINPGNSGGVLVDINGELIGVTAAIESTSQANSGIGFVIPSEIVSRVVPQLISTGKYEHSWLGISGGTITPEIIQAMGLPEGQHGVLVAIVTPGSPAANAGLHGGTKTVTINGNDIQVGGDIIIGIDSQIVQKFEDLVAYLEVNTQVGQKVTLKIVRQGQEQSLSVTLAARPAVTAQQTQPTVQPSTAAYLGIAGADLNLTLAKDMNLPANQEGVLVQQVTSGSPAAKAGLRAGNKSVTINGQQYMEGGDVIIAIDGNKLTGIADLRSAISQYNPGQQVSLTILRDGNQIEVSVVLGSQPVQ